LKEVTNAALLENWEEETNSINKNQIHITQSSSAYTRTHTPLPMPTYPPKHSDSPKSRKANPETNILTYTE
jgi:hypothetical protein